LRWKSCCAPWQIWQKKNYKSRFPQEQKNYLACFRKPLFFSWADLKDFFRAAGEVTYTDAHQRMGKNRGEVCFTTRDALHKAKDKFDGEEVNGRRIKIKITV